MDIKPEDSIHIFGINLRVDFLNESGFLDECLFLQAFRILFYLFGETVCPQNKRKLLSSSFINFLCSFTLEHLPDVKKVLLGARLPLLPEILLDLSGGVPAVHVHLVPAHVEHVRLEQLKEVLIKFVQHLVYILIDRIYLTAWRLNTVILTLNEK